MKLDMKPEWLLRMAEKEANGIVSVGGFACGFGESNAGMSAAATDRAALAQLVEWQRRKLRLSVEQLATQANVEIEEILLIEKGKGSVEPRTVVNLSNTLKLPTKKLMQLAGLVSPRDPGLERAAVRFAARSAPIDALTPEQSAALEEFVKSLAQ
ncbi:MAG TPA: helix-turn-helix transcriptional regulator [Planctomycetaceae bacterium]|nr:helix-turn-helix transcriptional regulator [Planctomycetaceae bacterium]